MFNFTEYINHKSSTEMNAAVADHKDGAALVWLATTSPGIYLGPKTARLFALALNQAADAAEARLRANAKLKVTMVNNYGRTVTFKCADVKFPPTGQFNLVGAIGRNGAITIENRDLSKLVRIEPA